jgi:hypothetical protein
LAAASGEVGVIPDGDSAPAPPLAIDVDPNKVTGFAKTVQTNVQGTITPTAPGVRSTLDMSVGFGEGNPSVALKAMLQKYGECLATMNQQLTNVGQYVDILVTAANQISTNYRSSDQLAQASNEDIDNVLNAAILAIKAKQKPIAGGPGRMRAE